MLPAVSNSPEIQRFARSIADLVATITEILSAKVQASVQEAAPASPQATAAYDPILTKRQLAMHLHVSARTIGMWTEKRYLPHYKIGRAVRFRLSDIHRAWDANHKRHSYGSLR